MPVILTGFSSCASRSALRQPLHSAQPMRPPPRPLITHISNRPDHLQMPSICQSKLPNSSIPANPVSACSLAVSPKLTNRIHITRHDLLRCGICSSTGQIHIIKPSQPISSAHLPNMRYYCFIGSQEPSASFSFAAQLLSVYSALAWLQLTLGTITYSPCSLFQIVLTSWAAAARTCAES